MGLCWNKGSLVVFSCFVSYESYHKKGTIGFKQRIVKELSELLLTINHSFSTLMQTIHKQLYERIKIIAVIDATAKGFLFSTANVASTIACDDLLSYNSSPRSSHIWFSYILITSYVNNFTRLTELKLLILKYEESLSRFQLG